MVTRERQPGGNHIGDWIKLGCVALFLCASLLFSRKSRAPEANTINRKTAHADLASASNGPVRNSNPRALVAKTRKVIGRILGWMLKLAPLGGVAGAVIALLNYNILSHSDRPTVGTRDLRLLTPDSDTSSTWQWLYGNSGPKDATQLTFKLGTIAFATKETKLLGADEAPRLIMKEGRGWTEFQIHKQDFWGFFVTCLAYSDDNGKHYDPEIKFYKLPGAVLAPNVVEPRDASLTETAALEAGFSCAKLDTVGK